MNLLLDLFLTFAGIGMFTFGGGYAMIAVIEHVCVEEKKWISHDDMMNITVIAESTPGPIAINCATFTGYRKKGFAGAAAATLGIVLPSFVIIELIAVLMNHFLEIAWIANAFKGIQLAVGILILDAGLKMYRKMKKPSARHTLYLSAAAMLVIRLFSLPVSSMTVMLTAGAFSLLLFFKDKKGGQHA